MTRQCLKVIRSWTKSVKWAKSPGQTPGPGRTSLNGSKPPRWMQNVMWWWNYQFLAPWDTHTHTHTHKAKPIHLRVAGCNNRRWRCSLPVAHLQLTWLYPNLKKSFSLSEVVLLFVIRHVGIHLLKPNNSIQFPKTDSSSLFGSVFRWV